MYVNEEGELRQLQVNENATKMVGYTIYGNVLILSPYYIINTTHLDSSK